MGNEQYDFSISDGSEVNAGLPAMRVGITEIVANRDAALLKMRESAEALQQAYKLTGQAVRLVEKATQGRRFYGGQHDRNRHYSSLFNSDFDAEKAVDAFRKSLDCDVWSFLHDVTGMRAMMDAQAARQFDTSLREDVPEVTIENVTATFSKLMSDSTLIFQRGLVKIFQKLSPQFKSHDAFKIQNRLIIERCFDENGNFTCYSPERLNDMDRCFQILAGRSGRNISLADLIRHERGHKYCARRSEHQTEFVKVKCFMNGNVHMWFTDENMLEKLNKTLADYYGDVVADAAEKDVAGEDFARRGANLPAHRWAFYPTPDAASDRLIDAGYIAPGQRVLEPSAGTGALVEKLLAKGVLVRAVEIHPARVEHLRQIKNDNLRVTEGNFLNLEPHQVYDCCVMNPPFAGKHFMQHIKHAWDFVKPGGRLVSILPATAEVSEDKDYLAFRRWIETESTTRLYETWKDLPPESFAESGTRINTVILRMDKPKE